MDPVSLIVGALAAGLSESVTGAVQDTYKGLRDALIRRIRRSNASPEVNAEQAVRALESKAADPQALHASIKATDLGDDPEVVSQARLVLEAADRAGIKVGKYVVDLREAKGVQVGDNPNMTINF
ncbi:hypothetical protein [Actinoplanes auranticolor]|uniref:RHIM domain-containing protein n=1 Tax=Actinoplanes auranticolor TaxID=47988 RepID=A0A919SK30_9ACTN|nr:hypothetical protein [Actinoplanes auranticolor]GIM72413.1 hypothetical protein Aau02nite_50860 [Actinoplanes auranticolor]